MNDILGIVVSLVNYYAVPLGLLLNFFGSFFIISVDHPDFNLTNWLERYGLPRWIKNLNQGKETLRTEGEISEGDTGFEEVDTALRRGWRTELDITRIEWDVSVVDPDPVKVESRDMDRPPHRVSNPSNVLRWFWNYRAERLRRNGFYIIAAGFALQLLSYLV